MINTRVNISVDERRAQRKTLSYVLVTPARNESEFIERTIQSVLKQTILPLKWVIVSDGSTDGTDDIVSRYTVSQVESRVMRPTGSADAMHPEGTAARSNFTW